MRENIKKAYDRVWDFQKRKPTAMFFIVYTVLFILIFYIISLAFLKQGRLFLGLGDGPSQLYPSYYYANTWLKELFSNIFHGNFTIPMWSFHMGMGSDIITTLHCNVIGDPFALLTLLSPVSKMELMYYIIVYAKFYCIGLAFYAYCRTVKIGWFEALIGSLLYTFSSYSIVTFLPMIIFGNAIIYLPLIFIGLEKILRKEKPHFFVFMVALSTITNFYFLYMLTVLIFLYGIIRYLFSYPSKISDFFKTFLKAGGLYLVGVLMGCIMFLPVASAFFNSSRAGSVSLSQLGIFYGRDFYKTFFAEFMAISPGANYTNLAFAAISIFALIYIFFNKGKSHWLFRAGFIFLSLIMLLPVGGWIMNGFGYPVNRWMFGYVFMICIITAAVLPNLYRLSKRNLLLIGALLFIYFSACIYYIGLMKLYTFMSICIAALLFGVFAVLRDSKSLLPIKVSVLALTCFFLSANGYMIYSDKYMNGASGYYLVNYTQEYYNTYLGNTAGHIKDDSFARMVLGTEPNDSMLNQYNGYLSYWSIQSKDIFNLYKDQNIPLHFLHYYLNFENDPYLTTLTAAKYAIVIDKPNYMFGYEKTETPDGCIGDVYENQYSLPLGFTYDSAISKQEYDSLSVMDKKRMLLKSVVLENELPDTLGKENILPHTEPIGYTIKKDKNVVVSNNKIELINGNGELTLNTVIPKNQVTYLSFKNLHFDRTQWVQVKYNDNVMDFHYLNPDFLYYYNNHDFLLCLGMNETQQDSIKISFGGSGCLTYDELNVYSLDMKDYIKDVEARSADKMENIAVGDNKVSGNIHVNEDKTLFLSIPYSEGWTAKVNSKEVDIQKANVSFMAIPVTSGDNQIELSYTTPWIVEGAAISLTTIAAYIIIVFIYRKYKNSLNKKEADPI